MQPYIAFGIAVSIIHHLFMSLGITASTEFPIGQFHYILYYIDANITKFTRTH